MKSVAGSRQQAARRALNSAPYLLPAALCLLVLVLSSSDLAAQGCAMCKATVESGQDQSGVFGGEQAVGAGLNKGILFLMTVPYLLLFLFFRKRILGFFKEFATAKG